MRFLNLRRSRCWKFKCLVRLLKLLKFIVVDLLFDVRILISITYRQYSSIKCKRRFIKRVSLLSQRHVFKRISVFVLRHSFSLNFSNFLNLLRIDQFWKSFIAELELRHLSFVLLWKHTFILIVQSLHIIMLSGRFVCCFISSFNIKRLLSILLSGKWVYGIFIRNSDRESFKKTFIEWRFGGLWICFIHFINAD